MHWEEAQRRIKACVEVGTDLNTPASTYRYVQAVDAPIHSARYGYQDERGLVVSIGRNARVSIPWSVLRDCVAQLDRTGSYDGAFFRSRFPLQARDHGCHVHVIGQILVVAGLARLEGNRYLIEERQDRGGGPDKGQPRLPQKDSP